MPQGIPVSYCPGSNSHILVMSPEPSQQITITGDQDATWYLNGLKLRPQMKQAQTTEPGINTITAVRGDCSETNEFFVEF